jgi:hypothetical protein
MLNAVVVDNGIRDLKQSFPIDPRVSYRFIDTRKALFLENQAVDLLIVPNGSDHVALSRGRDSIYQFLNNGGALFCFDGWFTDWIPGNQWVMDNSKPTREIRYTVTSDRHNLLRDISLDEFIFRNGISGWWACGYIASAPKAEVLLADTWQRPVVVLDEQTTSGLLFLTASGPLPMPYFGSDTFGPNQLYSRMLNHVIQRRQTRTGGSSS